MQTLEHIRIVLVETSHPGNIGGAARAMKTMGLSSLWLVRPERFPDPQADWRAVDAVDVLDGARICTHLDEAIDDCGYVLGTSARHRRLPWTSLTARSAALSIVAEPATRPIAILFGRETSGLNNDELQRCNAHIEIPANPAYPSLNLAMAVQVICYELFQSAQIRAGITHEVEWDRRPATVADLERLYAHLDRVLGAIEFYDPANPRQALTRLRRLFSRVRPDETEVRMLRGILTQVERQLGRVGRDEADRGHTGPN
jgi:tRNA (cytidine32/uridine32-2'-O)-methyltransferase